MMRRKLTILLVAFALVLSVGQAAKGSPCNILADPNFELNGVGWELWTWAGGKVAIDDDPAIQLDGNYLRASGTASGGTSGAAQDFPIASEGDVLCIQGWVRTSEDATGQCAAFAVAWGDATYSPSLNNFLRRDVSSVIGEPALTGEILDWTFVRMETPPAPAGTVTARIECFNNLGGVGIAYFDEMSACWDVCPGVKAKAPIPADGAVGVRPTPTLSWRPGTDAASHDVYFGTSWADVNDGTAFIQNQEPNTYDPGTLLLDTDYYWRIDEVNTFEPNSPWKGDVWSFTVAAITASRPSPADGEPEANRYSLLNWTPGADANSHDVYFGTDFNDVNAATPGTVGVYQGNQPYDDTSYDPNVLEIEETYYWRIDEVNEADPNIWKGDVWSFTVGRNLLVNPGFEDGSNVDPWSEGIDPPPWFRWTWGEGWVSWKSDLGQGNDPPLAHGGDKFIGISAWTDPPELWVAGAGLSQDLPANPGDILTASVWARTEIWGVPFGNLKVEFKDMVGGTILRYDESFIINEVEPDYTQYSMTTRPAPEGTTIAEFIIMATNQGTVLFDDAILEFGPPEIAWNPRPIQGAVYVDRNADLSWNAGVDAVTHDVYFGADFNDVSDADNSWPVGGQDPEDPNVYKGNQALANTSYELGVLEPTRTYYWRIDEVNGLDIWRGETWRFTTGDYIVVEDFDSYANSTALYEVWTDYWTNGTRAELFPETDIVRDGNSLSYEYGNDNSPYYSESKANISDLAHSNPDWFAYEIKALSLWFYGDSGNSTTVNDRMYLALEDTDGNLAVVPYDGDADDLKLETWQEWNIAMEDFNEVNNVDLSSIASIYIGFGDRYDPAPGDDGSVYFDDIRLYLSRCIPAHTVGDATGDCIANFEDLIIMAGDWLDSEFTVTVSEPTGELIWYKFDNDGTNTTAVDSSGNGYDGTVSDADWVTEGHIDGALNFDGTATQVDVPPAALTSITTKVTIALWQYGNPEIQPKADNLFEGTRVGEPNGIRVLNVHLPYDDGRVVWCAGNPNDVYSTEVWDDCERIEKIAVAKEYEGRWNHWTFIKDCDANNDTGVLEMYLNGLLWHVGYDVNVPLTDTIDNEFLIGTGWDGYYAGVIDDFRIYDKVLTQAEISYLATDGTGYYPLQDRETNFNEEGQSAEKIDFMDFALMADYWFQEQVWP
jgi:hypothetical protein